MNPKILKKIYEIITIAVIIFAWYGLVPTTVFAIESTLIVMGFLLVSLIGTVYAGNRIVKAIKAIGEINEETD